MIYLCSMQKGTKTDLQLKIDKIAEFLCLNPRSVARLLKKEKCNQLNWLLVNQCKDRLDKDGTVYCVHQLKVEFLKWLRPKVKFISVIKKDLDLVETSIETLNEVCVSLNLPKIKEPKSIYNLIES